MYRLLKSNGINKDIIPIILSFFLTKSIAYFKLMH